MTHEIIPAAIARTRAQAAKMETAKAGELDQYYTFEQLAKHVTQICNLLKVQEVKHAMGLFGAEIYLEVEGQNILVMEVTFSHDLVQGRIIDLGYTLPTPEGIDKKLERLAMHPLSHSVLASTHCDDAKARTQVRQPAGPWSTE